MYVVDRPLRRPRSPIPTYDVKIIAGRRVVIFHDKKGTNGNQEIKYKRYEQLKLGIISHFMSSKKISIGSLTLVILKVHLLDAFPCIALKK